MKLGFKTLGTILLLINIVAAILYIVYKNQIIGTIYLICGIIAICLLAFALQDSEENKNFDREKYGDYL